MTSIAAQVKCDPNGAAKRIKALYRELRTDGKVAHELGCSVRTLQRLIGELERGGNHCFPRLVPGQKPTLSDKS